MPASRSNPGGLRLSGQHLRASLPEGSVLSIEKPACAGLFLLFNSRQHRQADSMFHEQRPMSLRDGRGIAPVPVLDSLPGDVKDGSQVGASACVMDDGADDFSAPVFFVECHWRSPVVVVAVVSGFGLQVKSCRSSGDGCKA